MKINNIDISAYSAKLINRQASTQNINSIIDWYDEAVDGSVLRQNYEFKTLGLTFLVTETTEDLAYKQISALTEALKKAELKFDDIDLIFPCVLQGSNLPERVHNSQFKITYLLKNDWGVGKEIVLDYTFVQPTAKPLTVNYKTDWSESIGYYVDCFDADEKIRPIAKEKYYIDLSTLQEKANRNQDWQSFLIDLGVNVDKYKNDECRSGAVQGLGEYTSETAIAAIQDNTSIDIHYMKMRVPNIEDVPKAKYPSIVWTTGKDNQYYFDLGVGKGWDIRDISIIVYGRYFKMESDSNGSMFGGLGDSDAFNMALTGNDMSLMSDSIATSRKFKVFNSNVQSGGNFIIETFESISATPIRKYGLKSSNEGPAAVYGYCDVIFNGLTLDRIPLDSYTLTGNLSLMKGKQGIGEYCEAARVQIYYKNKKIKDLIPIASSVKNCFFNNYDAGLYDVDKMEFIPWTNATGKGQEPLPYMPLPDVQPPTPPAKKYTVTVNYGSGSGKYEADAVVTFNANPAPEGQRFKEWVIQKGSPVFDTTQEQGTFVMPAEDVEITATYEEKPPAQPELLFYPLSDLTDETVMGANAKPWATSAYDSTPNCGPTAYDMFYAVYSIPNIKVVQWHFYSGFTGESTGIDKFGRYYAEFTAPSRSQAAWIEAELEDGTRVRKDFYIKSI